MKKGNTQIGWWRFAMALVVILGIVTLAPSGVSAQCGGLCHPCGWNSNHMDNYNNEWWYYPFGCTAAPCPNSCVWAFSPEWDTDETVGLTEEFDGLVAAVDHQRFDLIAEAVRTQTNVHLNVHRQMIQVMSGSTCEETASGQISVIAQIPLTRVQFARVRRMEGVQLAELLPER